MKKTNIRKSASEGRFAYELRYRSEKRSGLSVDDRETLHYYFTAASMRGGLERACNSLTRQFSTIRVDVMDRKTGDVVEVRRYTCPQRDAGGRRKPRVTGPRDKAIKNRDARGKK